MDGGKRAARSAREHAAHVRALLGALADPDYYADGAGRRSNMASSLAWAADRPDGEACHESEEQRRVGRTMKAAVRRLNEGKVL